MCISGQVGTRSGPRAPSVPIRGRAAMTVEPAAFQDCYSDANAHCYGCGRLNDRGLRIRTTWDPDDESASLTIFTPDDHLTGGVPGNLYGGILASLIDCHSTATASAVRARRRSTARRGRTAEVRHGLAQGGLRGSDTRRRPTHAPRPCGGGERAQGGRLDGAERGRQGVRAWSCHPRADAASVVRCDAAEVRPRTRTDC